MKIHSFSLKKMLLGISLSLILLLFIVSAAPPTSSVGDDSFSLTVRIQSRHISDFEVCVPVKVNEQFRISWGNEQTKSNISGVLRPPVGDKYPVALGISKGSQCYSKIEQMVKLGKGREWAEVISLGGHIDRRSVVLAKGNCK